MKRHGECLVGTAEVPPKADRIDAARTTFSLVPQTALSRRSKIPLFDHLISTREQRGRHTEAKRLGGLEINHQLILGWGLYRQVARLLALEDTIDVSRGLPELVEEIRPVGDQSPGIGIIALLK